MPADPTVLTFTADPAVEVAGLPDRYDAAEVLARGGQGAVYLAVDRVTARPVVVKVLALDTPVHAGRFAREAAVLRLLDLPGVVRLLDSGVSGGTGWIVMDRVDGEPFPAGRTTWAALEPTVVALLDTLARVHDAGFVHRDLKPGNVLVDAAGRPTVLDFGLVRGDDSATLTRVGAVMGTPRYMAPEQIRGERVDARTDLYAVGLMIWEALTGAVPDASDEVVHQMRERLRREAPPIAGRVPDLPPHAAALIDAMVSRRASARPATARRALRALREAGTTAAFPWLGPRDAIDRIVDAALAGRRIVVGGARGAGRTRLCQEAAVVLAARGRVVHQAAPEVGPLRSLRGFLGEPAVDDPDAIGTMRQRLQAGLDAGEVVIVDELSRMDAWSKRLISAATGAVVVVGGAGPADVTPARLRAEDLVPLFHGPERLLHLPSDAARLLARRSGGRAASVAAEADRWVALGLARWDGDRLRTDRAALGRIEAGLMGLPVDELDDDELPPNLDDLLAWVHLGGPDCTVDRLARARGEPRWEVELALAELEARGVVAGSASIIEPLRPARALQGWDAEKRMAAHAAVARATPVGTSGRLMHLVAVGDARAVEQEALHVATVRSAEGRVSEAMAALEQAASVAAGASPALWALLAGLALDDGSRTMLARAKDALGRCGATGVLPQLVEVGLELVTARRADAIAVLETIAQQEDPAVERLRWELRLLVARGEAGAAYDTTIAAAARWAEGVGTPEILAARAAWVSTWAYQEGRQQEAAAVAEEGARLSQSLPQRRRLMLRALSCRLEFGEVDAVRAIAAELRQIGRERRLPGTELLGEWAERAVVCRLRTATGVDDELVDAVGFIDVPEVAGLTWVTEATIAWQLGQRDVGAALAGRAERAYQDASQPAPAAWAWALRVACAGGREDAEKCAAALVATGRDDVIAQGLALLHRSVGIPDALVVVCRRAIEAFAGDLNPEWPRGALSIREMRETLPCPP